MGLPSTHLFTARNADLVLRKQTITAIGNALGALQHHWGIACGALRFTRAAALATQRVAWQAHEIKFKGARRAPKRGIRKRAVRDELAWWWLLAAFIAWAPA